jgi:hypothetical protein
MRLRQRIEEAATRSGFRSMRALSKACGVSNVWLLKVAEEVSPGAELLDKVAEITGVSAHWLRDGRPHDAPDWARDYADADIETYEALRSHLLTVLPATEREAFLPRHPTAEEVARWITRGQATGWAGDQHAVWRGWMRASSQLEHTEILRAIGLPAQLSAAERVAQLEAELAEARAAIVAQAAAFARAEQPMREAASPRSGYRIGSRQTSPTPPEQPAAR